MTTQTLTLTEFLLARIAEDEREARDARRQWATYANDVAGRHYGAGMLVMRHNPARVLAECEAKRRIVEFYVDREVSVALSNDTPPEVYAAQSIERCLQMISLPYADHPDYDESWRP